MNRIPFGYADEISKALSKIPRGIRDRIKVDFLCGVDPVFVGLHRFTTRDANHAGYGGQNILYSRNAHFFEPSLYGLHGRPTIVLPSRYHHPATIIHEMGHALHAIVGYDHDAVPSTRYARVNRWESYADAFMAWCGYECADGQWDIVLQDKATLAHFESLC